MGVGDKTKGQSNQKVAGTALYRTYQKFGKSPYCGTVVQLQFLFSEMRITAQLLVETDSEEEVISRIVSENLYQYPTKISLRKVVVTCIHRLKLLNDISLIEAVAMAPSELAKQICLYAMMKQNRLISDFMVGVIGEKFRTHDYIFGKIDLDVFFFRLQEHDDKVAMWSDGTVAKMKQLIKKLLLENGYFEKTPAKKLSPVILFSSLEAVMRHNEDEYMLPAFNQFM